MNYQSSKVYVPEPCHEDWNKMTPKEQGRFCDSCSKVVVDFTKMSNQEVRDYLQENSNQRVCGHFKKSQLDIPAIEIKLTAAHYKLPMISKFLLASFLVFGFNLYTSAQTKTTGGVAPVPVTIKVEGKAVQTYHTQENLELINGQTVIEEYLEGDVEYIPEEETKKDTLKHHPVTEEEALKPKVKISELIGNVALKPVQKETHEILIGEVIEKPVEPEPVPEKETLLLGKPAMVSHEHIKGDVKVEPTDKEIDFTEEPTAIRGEVALPIEDTPPASCSKVVDQLPTFRGGHEGLMKYMQKHIQYTREAARKKIEGTVYVSFVVDKQGHIKDPFVKEGLGYGLDELALETIRQMPEWNPGLEKSEPVDVELTLPIQFSLR